MKSFKINAVRLKEAISRLKEAYNSKSLLPVLQYMYVQVENNKLTLTITDLSTTISHELEIIGEVSFEMLLHYEDAKKICGYTDGDITVISNYHSETDNEIIIKLEDSFSEFNLGIHPPIADYPKLPEMPTKNPIQLNCTLIPTLNAALLCASEDELRPAMTHVLLDINPFEINVVATDSHILFSRKIKHEVGINQQLLVSPKAIKAMDGFTQTVIAFTKKNIAFKCGPVTIITTQLEAQYPDFKAVIPQFNVSLSVGYGAFEDAINKSLFIKGGNEEASHTLFTFTDSDMHMKTNDLEKTKHVNVSLTVDRPAGADLPQIAFNPKNLKVLFAQLKVLGHKETFNIQASITSPIRAALFKITEDDTLLFLAMPVMIQA